ncbi:hypothetical protein VT06_04925, partial [Arsukibacterium sp. MJ3]
MNNVEVVNHFMAGITFAVARVAVSSKIAMGVSCLCLSIILIFSTDIKLKPFHKQFVKMAAPEFMREVFEKALALHLPDMFCIRDKYQE